MKLEFNLAKEFGPRLADGEQAAEFRTGRIEPYLDAVESVIFDFSAVRSANSSFVNALISGLIVVRGEKVLRKLIFQGCNPTIKVLVTGAIHLGLEKHAVHT